MQNIPQDSDIPASVSTPTSSDALPAVTFGNTSFDASLGNGGMPPSESITEPTGEPTEHRLQFTGSGGEYFRIWIVNLLLSILTLGIYSAWAKVRREQYFHRNTLLDGSGFDYHGKPTAILKGRVIAYGLLIALAVLKGIAPDFYYPALILVFPILPWLLLRSFIFRARNTSWRGVRFNFHGAYAGLLKAFWVYILVALLCALPIFYIAHEIDRLQNSSSARQEQRIEDIFSPVSDMLNNDDAASEESIELAMFVMSVGLLCAALLYPALIRRFSAFKLNHLSFGASRFGFTCKRWPFYRVFLLACLPTFVFVILIAVLKVIATAVYAKFGPAAAESVNIVTALAVISGYIAMLLSGVYFKMGILNLTWNNAQLNPHRLNPHRFVSDQKLGGLLAVVIVNWLLIGLTLGLFWPWAKVRLAEYRLQHMALATTGSLEEFSGQQLEEQRVAGEEIAEAFDFDISL